MTSFSYEEISKLDAGSWFGDKFKGEKVAKLTDLLELLAKYPDVAFIFDIHPPEPDHPAYPGYVERIVAEFRKYNLMSRVIPLLLCRLYFLLGIQTR